MRLSQLVACASLASAAFAPTRAGACGASSGGVPGTCNVEDEEEAMRPKLHAGAGGTFTATSLRFGGDRRADQARWLAVGDFELRPAKAVIVSFGAGALFTGHLSLPTGHARMRPGFAGAAGVAYRFLDARGLRPFLVTTLQLSSLVTTTAIPGEKPVGYEAVDLRAGLAAGWPIGRRASAYVAGRAFGGPIFWRVAGEAVTGTDAYHVQLGAGASSLVARHVDLFVEGIPLGEQGISAGGGIAF